MNMRVTTMGATLGIKGRARRGAGRESWRQRRALACREVAARGGLQRAVHACEWHGATELAAAARSRDGSRDEMIQVNGATLGGMQRRINVCVCV